ncbi:TPA: hypothetical protein DF272_05980 [Candidatus Falkowbacteria bacterium]|nr:hypothetical protein [Candidatus Falkowbacteria bacterium]
MLAGVATLGALVIVFSLICFVFIIGANTSTNSPRAALGALAMISWVITTSLLIIFFIFVVGSGSMVVVLLGCLALFFQLVMALSMFGGELAIALSSIISLGMNISFYVVTLANLS